MATTPQNPMEHELSCKIANELHQIIETCDFELISETFDDFLQVDAGIIQERADQFIAQTDIDDMAQQLSPGEDLRYRLMMDTFYASMLDYLCDKCADCDNAVEHDIPNWIEGNAPKVASFNAQPLRLAISDGDLEDIDSRLSIEHLEARQQAMLEETWDAIKTRIDTLLATVD